MTTTPRLRSLVPYAAFLGTAAAIFFGIVAGLDSPAIGSTRLALASTAALLSGGLAYWQVKTQIQQQTRLPQLRSSSSRNLPGTGNLFQLPPDIEDFTGHYDQAAALAEQLVSRDSGTALPLVTLYGKGGVGKTTLALHVAHRVRAHFPDGQIYVDLRGAEAQPLRPGEVLTRFLSEMGVEPQSIPENPEDRARIYRAQLAERRVLLVLDNARNEAQVRPLLPGNPDCAVLITSRTRLIGLAGAHIQPVEIMRSDHSVDLLKAIVGRERVSAEPEPAREIAQLCGHLPLALRIAGARLSARPMEQLAAFATRLRDETGRLDLLKAGDLAVRANFALSYHGCDASLRRAFRLLGTVKAQVFSPVTLAALADVPVEEAAESLEQLTDFELVEVAETDRYGTYRYRLHDLLRVFAQERLAEEEAPEARRSAAARLIDLYITLTTYAASRVKPGAVPETSSAPPAPETLRADPKGWLRSERSTYLNAVGLAVEHNLEGRAWRLAQVIATLPCEPTDWEDWTAALQAGLTAAIADATVAAEADLRRALGSLHRDRGDYEPAVRELTAAIALHEQLGDDLGAAVANGVLGDTYRYTGQLTEGIECFRNALAVFRANRMDRRTAWALNGLGDLYRGSGRWQESFDCFTECVQLYDSADDRAVAAKARIRFGILHRDQCRYREAERLYADGLAVLRQEGDRRWEARALRHMGVLWRNMGDTDRATATLREALDIFESLLDRRGIAVTLRNLGDNHRRAGQPAESLRSLEEALRIFRVLGDHRWEARTHISLADTLRREGDGEQAASHLAEASSIYRTMGYPQGDARVRYSSGQLHLQRREWPAACTAFDEARAAFLEMGEHIWAARALARSAEALKAQGDAQWRETRRRAYAECRRHGAEDDSECAQWLAAW
ncbi:ATP-binding protein [Streptomyces sp. 3N207]|uniref:ATP-binding protein n=1 Tax=Streptomyces sp. 3N207 TaxID=3457417 RepID=UPI003FD08A7E